MSIQVDIHCHGLKRAESYNLSELPSICACWVSSSITSKRLSVWQCKRHAMNLDIQGFMRAFESLHLDNRRQRYQLGKWRVLRCHYCWVMIVTVWVFLSFLWTIRLLRSLGRVISVFFVFYVTWKAFDRPQVYGYCSVDQVSSHRDYRELLSLILF